MELRIRVNIPKRREFPARTEHYGPFPSMSVAKINADTLQRHHQTDVEIIDENDEIVEVVTHYVFEDED
jgi:hypothetical protein